MMDCHHLPWPLNVIGEYPRRHLHFLTSYHGTPIRTSLSPYAWYRFSEFLENIVCDDSWVLIDELVAFPFDPRAWLLQERD
jgi:hypothetical protein